MKIHNKFTATLIDSMGNDLRVANAAPESQKRQFSGSWRKVIRVPVVK